MMEIPKQSVAENDTGWAFINKWKVEPQSDDRPPMLGVVAQSTAAPSARRSTARRKHQTMFKEWSKGRHD